jgi:ribosomal protein L7/L12
MLAVIFTPLVLLVSMGLRMDKSRQRIARLERRIELILGHLDIEEYGPAQREEVAKLVRDGKIIEAIKLYREMTGADHKEARAAVEAMSAKL